MIKCVIFDLGNTITNDNEVKKEVYEDFLKSFSKKYGIDIDLGRFKQIKDEVEENFKRVRETFGEHESRYIWFVIFGEVLGIKIEEKEAKDLLNNYNKINLSHLRLNEGVKETLQHIKEKKIKISLVTNAWPDFTELVLERFKLKEYFDVIIMTRKLGIKKSTLEPFKIILDKLNLNPEECLMVGDDIEEDGSVSQIGMKFCFFTKEAIEGKYDFRISRIDELTSIL